MKKINLRKTEQSDIPSLKKLWLDCFDEDSGAVSLIFDRYSDVFNGFCAECGTKIVSALYLVKCTINGEKAHYLCGAATEESFRKNGIMTALINFALADAEKSGDKYSVLLPANDRLYGYYAGFGYDEKCFAKSCKVKRTELEQRAVEHCSTGKPDFELLQKKCFKSDFLCFDEKFFEFAKEYYSIYSVKNVSSQNSFALFEKNDNTADVFYSAYSSINELSALLLKSTDAENFVFTTAFHNGTLKNAERKKCGMIKPLGKTQKLPDDVYIGLTLE